MDHAAGAFLSHRMAVQGGARGDTDIKAMVGDTIKDCMARRGLRRQIALGQNASQFNGQFLRTHRGRAGKLFCQEPAPRTCAKIITVGCGQFLGKM